MVGKVAKVRDFTARHRSRVRRDSPTVHLVASLGGHLELLTSTADTLDGVERVWVTSEGARAQSLRTQGDRVLTLPRLDRSSASVRTVLAGIVLALRERPRVVVTSGAGLAVPFCLTARLLGARLVFVETMARVRTGSASGRLLSRVTRHVLVQWPELLAVYPGAVVCRPALLEEVGRLGGGGGSGTFVTVGSHDQPFERLLGMVRSAAAAHQLPEPVFVQRGVSVAEPKTTTGTVSTEPWQDAAFITPAEFVGRVADASVVVSHGGAGAISTALRSGRRPLVVARRRESGEHVDDHQEELVAKLDQLGLIVLVGGTELTEEHVQRATTPFVWDGGEPGLPSVGHELASLVVRLASRRRRRGPDRP